MYGRNSANKLFVIALLVFGGVSDHVFADGTPHAFNTNELRIFLKGYSDKYGLRFINREVFGFEQSDEFPSLPSNVAVFNGQQLQPIFSSAKISERTFGMAFQGDTINSSIAKYLIKRGSKNVRECAERGNNRYIERIGFSWIRQNMTIHYVLSCIYEHPTVGSYCTLSFFDKDICGESLPSSLGSKPRTVAIPP